MPEARHVPERAGRRVLTCSIVTASEIMLILCIPFLIEKLFSANIEEIARA